VIRGWVARTAIAIDQISLAERRSSASGWIGPPYRESERRTRHWSRGESRIDRNNADIVTVERRAQGEPPETM